MKALVILGLGLLIGLGVVLGVQGSRDGLDVQVPLDAGVRLERTGLPDAAARARKSVVSAHEAAVGQERAAVGAGAQLQVVDDAGAPVADAVLAIELDASAGRGALETADAEGLPTVERVTADATGRIALSSLPRAGDWYVSAQGFDWSAVDAGDREVLLERLPLARIEAVDVFGSSSFAGKRVRWLGDPALTRLFPWMETIGAWRAMGPGALELGRLTHFGLKRSKRCGWTSWTSCSTTSRAKRKAIPS